METCTMCWAEHDWDGPCAPPKPEPKPPSVSVAFVAKFPGWCSECTEEIEEGVLVAYVGPDELAHLSCTNGRKQ